MNQKQSHANTSAKAPIASLMPAELSAIAQKNVEMMVDMQKELFDAFEAMNRDWLSWMRSESSLASEFVGKLAAAGSVPDAATACQECMTRQMEMLAEGGRQLFANSQKLVERGARYFSNGSAAGG